MYAPVQHQAGVYWVPNEVGVTVNDIERISLDDLQERTGIDVFPSLTDPPLRSQAEVPPVRGEPRGH